MIATSAYGHTLRAHGWVKVPMTLDTGIDFYTHERLPQERLLFRERWSHHHFDGTSWLTYLS